MFKKDRKSLLITGGSGFIGRNLVNSLSDKYDIYNLSHNSNHINKKCENISWDMNDPTIFDSVEKELHRYEFDACVHMASIVGNTDKSEKEYYTVNVDATHKLASFCATKSIKFLNISTGSVYAPTSDVIDTSSKRDPSTVYGLTKHASEILVRSVSVSSDLIAWNLRLFYPYGNDMPKNRYIASVFDRVKNGIPIDINLKQQFVFQPMHVIDLCNSIKCIIDYDYVSKGHVLNLSGREPITLIQMASIFGDVLNKQPCYVFTDKYGGDALVDTKFIESLCSGFGYKSWVNITDGLMEFANANK